MLGHLAPNELTSAGSSRGSWTSSRPTGARPLRIRNVIKVVSAFIKIVRVRELDPLLHTNPCATPWSSAYASHRRSGPRPCTSRSPKPRSSYEARRRQRGGPGTRWPSSPASVTARSPASRGATSRATSCASVSPWRSVGNGKPSGDEDGSGQAGRADAPGARGLPQGLARRLGEGGRPSAQRHRPDLPSPRRGVEGSLRYYRPKSAEQIRDDLAEVGIKRPEVDFHATRRSFSTWLEPAGVHPETVDRLLGHEPKSVRARHHSATDPGQLRAAVERIAWG